MLMMIEIVWITHSYARLKLLPHVFLRNNDLLIGVVKSVAVATLKDWWPKSFSAGSSDQSSLLVAPTHLHEQLGHAGFGKDHLCINSKRTRKAGCIWDLLMWFHDGLSIFQIFSKRWICHCTSSLSFRFSCHLGFTQLDSAMHSAAWPDDPPGKNLSSSVYSSSWIHVKHMIAWLPKTTMTNYTTSFISFILPIPCRWWISNQASKSSHDPTMRRLNLP